MKLVSIILPTFNGASRGFLEESIGSVLNQTYKNYELIIVDDGSNDDTRIFCEKYLKRPGIKYIYQENKGLAGARNTGIKMSKGEYICFIDDDDIWLKNKLKKQISFIKKHKDIKIGMVFTSIEFIEEDGRHRRNQSHIANGDIYKKLFYENIIDAPSSVMIKKEVFNEVGLFKEEMKSCEDYEIWFRIAKKYHIYSLNEVLVKYRLHKKNMSKNGKKSEFYKYLALYYALENDKSINEDSVYHNYYKKITVDRLLRRNYIEFRKYLKITLAYGRVGFYLRVMYLISYFYTLSRLFIKILRYIKKKIFKSL